MRIDSMNTWYSLSNGNFLCIYFYLYFDFSHLVNCLLVVRPVVYGFICHKKLEVDLEWKSDLYYCSYCFWGLNWSHLFWHLYRLLQGNYHLIYLFHSSHTSKFVCSSSSLSLPNKTDPSLITLSFPLYSIVKFWKNPLKRMAGRSAA